MNKRLYGMAGNIKKGYRDKRTLQMHKRQIYRDNGYSLHKKQKKENKAMAEKGEME